MKQMLLGKYKRRYRNKIKETFISINFKQGRVLLNFGIDNIVDLSKNCFLGLFVDDDSMYLSFIDDKINDGYIKLNRVKDSVRFRLTSIQLANTINEKTGFKFSNESGKYIRFDLKYINKKMFKIIV